MHRVIILVVIVFLLAHAGIACAQDTGENPMPGAHHFDITMAHGAGTKYIKFDGGGVNALHITTNPDDPYGQVTTTEEGSAEFFLSDTGGRGFFDDMILMVAVKGEIPDDFSLQVKTSGYRWTPTEVLNVPPAEENITYIEGSVDDTFTKEDFLYGPQSWKPAGNNDPMNYPIYFEQDMSDPSNQFHIMFIDLNAGLLGPNSLLTGLTDNGMIRLEYSIDNPGAMVAFNIYGWCNQSNQGRGISWTNRMSGEGSSGYLLMGASGQGGDTGQSGSAGYSMGYETGGETAEESGGQDGEFFVLEKVVVNGTVTILAAQEQSKTLYKGQSHESVFDLPVAADNIGFSRLYVYTRDGKNQVSGKGTDVDISLRWNGVAVLPERYYRAEQAGAGSPVAGTYCYNVTGLVLPARSHTVTVVHNGPPSAIVNVDGMALVVAHADGSAGQTTCWIGEGSLILVPDAGTGENPGESTVNFPLNGKIDLYPWTDAVLSVVGTQAAGESVIDGSIRLNGGEWEGIFDSGSPVSISSHDVSRYLLWSGNTISVQPPGKDAGLPMEIRGMIISVSHPANARPVAESQNVSIQYESRETKNLPEMPAESVAITPPEQGPAKTEATPPVTENAGGGIAGIIDDIIMTIFQFIIGPDQAAAVIKSASENPTSLPLDTGDEKPAAIQESKSNIPPGAGPGVKSYTLTISSDPADAEILLDGSLLDAKTPCSVSGLEVGDHTITLRKEMFLPIDVSVTVENDTILDVLLVPAYADSGSSSPDTLKESGREAGAIYADSYPRGAGIVIDGKKSRAITPAVISNLRPGYHSVKVEKGTTPYTMKIRTVTVLSGVTSRAFFSIEPLRSTSFRIESDLYDGKEFTVNGRQPVYRIPKKVTVEGVSAYVTVKDGDEYISKALSDYIQVGETVLLGLEELEFASVQVVSNPPGADVFFDGFPTGLVTPCRIDRITRGKHRIFLSKPGYIPEEKEFSVIRDPSIEVDATINMDLAPYVYGGVSVTSNPEGARIYIDDRYSGYTTPHAFVYMPIGSYSIEVESGDSSKYFDIDIAPDEEIRIAVDFEKGTYTKGTG
jgi:hypothetical protein